MDTDVIFLLQWALRGAQERPRQVAVMSRDDLNACKRRPSGCWKDPRGFEAAVLLHPFTRSFNKHWLSDYGLTGTLLSPGDRAENYLPSGGLYSREGYRDHTSNDPNHYLNDPFW